MKRGEIAQNVSRGAFYLSLEKVAAILSGLLYFALLLRWLGPTKYGIMALALSFTGLATMATGNFEVFLERYAAEYHAHRRFATLLSAHRLALLLKLVLGFAAAVLLALLSPFVAAQFNMPDLQMLLPLFALLVAFDGLSTTGRATLFGLQRFRAIFFVAVTFHIAKTAMVGLLWWSRAGLYELALGLVVIMLLQGIAMAIAPFWILREAQDETESGETHGSLIRALLKYSAPLLGARATFLAGQNLGKIVLGKLFEPFMLGYFSFSFQIVERFVELAQTVPSALLPSLTHLVTRGERDRLHQIFDQAHRLIQVAACALSLSVFAFAHELTILVGSPLFEPAVPLVRVMALVLTVRTAQQPLTMLFQALRAPGAVLRLAVLKFAAEFGSYLLFIPWLGLLGAGVANVFGAAVSYAAALFLLAVMFPEGARDRMGSAVRNLLLTLPFLVLTYGAGEWLQGPWSVVVRIILLLLAGLAVFALRQVNRYDLEKISSVPVRYARLARIRDGVVGLADSVARRFEPRGAA